MGQKVHPVGIRLGYIKDWASRWYAGSKEYPELLKKDLMVRDYIKKKLAHAAVSRIQINRPANNAQITVFTARPGIVIGKKGEDIDKLRREVSKMIGVPVHLNV
jgi:small subunit ribosomal protein S3